ncbi:MAG: PEGA domain-containing protein [Gammaproteobacteria bacterium]
MSRHIIVVDSNGERRVPAAGMPLSIGSQPTADIRIPGSVSAGTSALIDRLDDRPFIQPVAPGGIDVNGKTGTVNRWLEDGDVISVGGVRIACALGDGDLRLKVDAAALEYPTLPPDAAVGADVSPEPIEPVRPRARPVPSTADRRANRRIRIVGAVALGILAVVAAYLFTARAVSIDVDPPDAEVRLAGGLLTVKIGGRYLLRRGGYTVLLSADGYHPLREEIQVGDAASQSFGFEMRKLPGLLAVTTEPDVAARLSIDGQDVGALPGEPLRVEPGQHTLRIIADRYLDFETTLEVEGREVLQPLTAELRPGWGDVRLATVPAGADIYVDDEAAGVTPATVPVMAGTHRLTIRKDGHKPWERELVVEAGVPAQFPDIRLAEADGLLTVITSPRGAAVSVDGRYRGTTPLEVQLAPGRRYEVIASKAGFATVSRAVDMTSRRGNTVRLTLEARIGILRVTADPPDAELFIDGEPRGAAMQELSLPARPHKVEIRKDGFAPFVTEISPQPGSPESLRVRLLTPEEAVLAATPTTIETGDGTSMILVRPGGEFEMGAPRREQGRRPNEARHRVRLKRSYYIAATEVTNSQYQGFKPKHTSGAEKYRQLATGNHPAVMMSWEEATGYCNWLSARDGLPPAYRFENGEIVLAQPVGVGYRLPTEAEWAWAARFSGGGGQRKYPWGDRMPPAKGSGNFADRSARAVLPNGLSNYNDGFAVTAPVGSFRASPIGLFDLGGNVAEWINDRYTVYTQARGVEVDPVGPDKGQYHVIRGSGWRHSGISELRYAYRDFGNRGRLDVGFRIVRYADEPGE